jgi:hypothetical protein
VTGFNVLYPASSSNFLLPRLPAERKQRNKLHLARDSFLLRRMMSSWYVCLECSLYLPPALYYRWYDDSPVKIKGNRAFPKRKSAATDQTDEQRDRKGKMTVEASNGSQQAEFTAYSLLFTVPEAAAKQCDSWKPLWEPRLREIIRRSHQPIQKIHC